MPAPNPHIPGDNSFRLTPRTWYAWTIVPGYADYPHQSAIYLYRWKMVPTRKTFLEIVYTDAGYAEGAQDFERVVRVLAWTAHAMVCLFHREDGGHRVATISEVNQHWLEQLWPEAMRRREPGEGLQAFMTRVMPQG